MARIQTYNTDSNVTGNDSWIGSDGDNYNRTKNFTPNRVAKYFNSSERIDVSNSITFTYQTLELGEVRELGTLSFDGSQPSYVPFSSISNILISKRSKSLKYIDAFLQGNVDTTIILQRGNSVNKYGLFKVLSIDEYEEDERFFTFSLEFIQGNDGLEEDKDYIYSVVDFAQGVSIHNELEGLNDGDYIHLTQEEKEVFDNLPESFATKTSDLINDGEDGENPFITLQDIPPIDVSTLVPYTGADQNVELGENGLQAGFFKFDTTPTDTPEEQGVMFWDVDDNTVDIILNGYKMKVGEDIFYPVKNQTASTILKGTNVKFAGTVGASSRLLIQPFTANGVDPSYVYMGVTAEDIASGEDGKVLWFGRLRGLNTNSFNEGNILYASTSSAGGFQNTLPTGSNNIVQVAAVIKKSINQGVIFIRPQIEPLLFKPENVANKATDFSVINDTLYPSVEAVDEQLGGKLDKNTSVTDEIQVYVKNEDGTQAMLNKSEFGSSKEKRHYWDSPYSYCGVAPAGSLESAEVWIVTRIEVFLDGSTDIEVFTDISWTSIIE
jgi:hypothetical protein